MAFLKHYVWPLLVIFGAPTVLQILINYPRDSSMEGMYPVDEPLEGFKIQMLFGNFFSWSVITVWFAWNIFFLAIPFDHYIGRMSLFGYAPKYVHNGKYLYGTNFLMFLMFHSFYPYLCFNVYMQLPYIVGTLNVIGIVGTFTLWVLADPKRIALEKDEKLEAVPYFYELFRGMMLHPRYFDIDVKQLMIRIAFNTWQILILCYMMVGYLQHGFDPGMFAITFIQCIYLFYFYKWEKGFLISLDMTYGRTGFYFIWGCTNWIPFFYSYTTCYLVNHSTKLSFLESVVCILAAVFIIQYKFKVDEEKLKFKEAEGGECRIQGKPASYLEVKYETNDGHVRSRLLTSGYWGVARHLNYTFELLCALSWSLMTYRVNSVLTFLYPIYLLVLLIHRTYRDEAKCQAKYGDYWQKYCSIVKYKMIPHLF